VTSSVVRDKAGKFLYGIRVMRDITAQRHAEDALRASERRFRELIEALPAAVYTTDAAGRITFYNQAAVELAGRRPQIGDLWCVTWKMYRPDGTPLPHDECPMAIALRENRAVRGTEAVAERPDGTRVPFIPYPTPLRDENGELIGAVNMLVDISERKQAEANQRVLLDELNHRVKNNMQMLQSLLYTATRQTQNPEARKVLEDAARRIAAMAAAQRVLYSTTDATRFSAGEFLEAVCQSAQQTFAPNVKIVEQESMRIMMFQINNQRPPLNDVHVRRAISYAFDYDGFNKDILGGSVERNPVPIPNNLWGVPRDVKGYTYNVDRAKQELAQAKVKVDRPLTVGYLQGFSQTEQAATVMANGLRKVGLDTKLTSELWPTMVERMKKSETSPDLVVYWISTYYADPHNWIGEMFHSGQWGTFKASSFYKNPRVDELLDAALKSTDRKVREKAYQDAARIVVDDAAGVWIYNTKYFGPWAKNLEGIRFSPIGNGQEMRWVHY